MAQGSTQPRTALRTVHKTRCGAFREARRNGRRNKTIHLLQSGRVNGDGAVQVRGYRTGRGSCQDTLMAEHTQPLPLLAPCGGKGVGYQSYHRSGQGTSLNEQAVAAACRSYHRRDPEPGWAHRQRTPFSIPVMIMSGAAVFALRFER